MGILVHAFEPKCIFHDNLANCRSHTKLEKKMLEHWMSSNSGLALHAEPTFVSLFDSEYKKFSIGAIPCQRSEKKGHRQKVDLFL